MESHFGRSRSADGTEVEGHVDVWLTWTVVPFADAYEVESVVEGARDITDPPPQGNQITFRYMTPAMGQRGFVTYRVRSLLRTGATPETFTDGGRTVRVAANATVYSPWGPERHISYHGGNPFGIDSSSKPVSYTHLTLPTILRV